MSMNTSRLEAFSDGVLAVVITVMVLDLKVPQQEGLAALRSLMPVLLTYVLSFLFIGIYWSNHHHMLHATRRVTGGVLWANLHLLFWLSLFPFVTSWVGQNPLAVLPTALYGVILAMSAVAYAILARTIIAGEGPDSLLARAIGNDRKGKISLLVYVVSIPIALLKPWISQGLFVVVAFLWLVPDRRIERAVPRD
jgi:uncharacterized membrane protein